MSTASTMNNRSSNGSCTRTVEGNVCITFSIANIDDSGPDKSFDIISSQLPDIDNLQSDKPLKSNGKSALNTALSTKLGQALADYINARWNSYYFQNGQSFEVCANFAGTVDAESDNGPASADIDIGNVDISPL